MNSKGRRQFIGICFLLFGLVIYIILKWNSWVFLPNSRDGIGFLIVLNICFAFSAGLYFGAKYNSLLIGFFGFATSPMFLVSSALMVVNSITTLNEVLSDSIIYLVASAILVIGDSLVSRAKK